MIATPAAEVAAPGETDLAALGRAVAACDRQTVGATAAQEDQRHGAFLLDAYGQQQRIVADHAALAQRRAALRLPAAHEDRAATKQAESDLTAATQEIEDRQTALDDSRTLDKLRQDMVAYFRQLYLRTCQGRGK